MIMDYSEFSNALDNLEFSDEVVLPSYNFADEHQFGNDDSLDLSFLDIPIHSPDLDANNFSNSTVSFGGVETNSPDDNVFSDDVLKFLNQILMEDKIEEKPSMFPDPLALQEAENSFHEALGENYITLPHQPQFEIDQNVLNTNDFLGSSSQGSTSASAGDYFDPLWFYDSLHQKPPVVQNHPHENLSSSNLMINGQESLGSVKSTSDNVNGQVDSSLSTLNFANIFSDSESMLQFKRGMEEASKFLPSSTQLVIDLDKFDLPSDSRDGPPEVLVKVEKDDILASGSRGRKHYHRQDSVVEGERSSKQLAIYREEAELSEMFDKVLLYEPVWCSKEEPSEMAKGVLENGQPPGSNVSKTRSKKQGTKTEIVDLRSLLISCAQSVAADDRRSADEQLKQIRLHSSACGDASQRLADIFADGLEARIAGTGTEVYTTLASKRISATEKLKAYQVYLSACPFKIISIFFMNKMILEKASNAETLHIIDFGIQYGFQWPILIQMLSRRSGGPPKLRITGIELPLPGFRPEEKLDETGRRLEKYCERFNVPFEYHAIATQKWETIKIGDLKIEKNEFVAVNCLLRFKNLLDETVVVNSPRDAVLKLIRNMNPDIFTQAVVNGSYSVPFFVTRFREALFHYSALFDIFHTTLPHEDKHRLVLEREFHGREAINIIACEGLVRVERPETYKQWQVRNMRAGFTQLPLNPDLLKKLRSQVKAGYHKDFVFAEDGNWMLQGWKGRILYAASCWVPA